jgi:hypothetical protein
MSGRQDMRMLVVFSTTWDVGMILLAGFKVVLLKVFPFTHPDQTAPPVRFISSAITL